MGFAKRMRKHTDEEIDEFIDRQLFPPVEPFHSPYDIYQMDKQVYIDIETITDCDDRPDFLQLNALERIHSLMAVGELELIN